MRSVLSLKSPRRAWLAWTVPKRAPGMPWRLGRPSARAISLAVTILATVAVLATFVADGRRATTQDLAGTVTLTIVSGGAEVRPAGAGAFFPARDGQVLRAGDAIRTDADGRAIVTSFEGSSTAIGASSTSVIGRPREPAQREPAMASEPRLGADAAAAVPPAVVPTWRRVAHLLSRGVVAL